MATPGCRCLVLAVVLACAAAAASVPSEGLRHSRKLSFDPIQTCKNQAETCSKFFLPLFQQCCDGQNLTCWQGAALDTTRCVKRPQPPTATVISTPGNWTIIIKPQGLPASLAPQLFCSSSTYAYITAKDPWGQTYSTNTLPKGNNGACLKGPLQSVFPIQPGVYKCGTQYDISIWFTFNESNPALTSDIAKVPGNPVTAPPCLNPAKWTLTIDEPSCGYRYLKAKLCAEGSAGMNVTATRFQASYLDRLFTIKPAPGHSGALVGAGTPVNIISAGRAGACAAVNLASASSTCAAAGLVQSANAAAQPSQWVLESAGKPGLIYIRSVARTAANCPARYLGVSTTTCNMAFDQYKYGPASLFVKNPPGARTVWRLERA